MHGRAFTGPPAAEIRQLLQSMHSALLVWYPATHSDSASVSEHTDGSCVHATHAHAPPVEYVLTGHGVIACPKAQ